MRAYVMIVCKGEVLLIQNWLSSGKWSFPGGGLRRGEAPKAGAIREVFEETGLIIEQKDLKIILQGNSKKIIGGKNFIIFMSVVNTKPKIELDTELTDFAWVPINQAQGYRLTNEAATSLIQESDTANLL